MTRFVSALLLAIAVATASPAAAQTDGSYDADSLSESGFATGDSDADEVPGGVFMLLAYCAFFALLAGYTVNLSQRQARVQREFGDLRRSLEDIDDQLAERGIDA